MVEHETMTSLISSHVIANSQIRFGTSGARGLATNFSVEVCCAFCYVFIHLLRLKQPITRVALAIDNRPSSPSIAAYCYGALQSLGIQVDYYGVLPTPALAHKAFQDGIAAIMVTGSHISFERNGLKFYRPQGEITKQDEMFMLSTPLAFQPSSAKVLPLSEAAAAELYLQRYLNYFPKDLAKGYRIGIYAHSAAGSDLYLRLFKELGADVVVFGYSNEFVSLDTEALSIEDEKNAKSWVADFNLDMIFSTDGDGDRPLIADDRGVWWRGDTLGILAAKALNITNLAVPMSCTTAIEHSGYFRQVIRTKIGSPFVISKLLDLAKPAAGFEANGGFILATSLENRSKLLTALPTRDAVLPFLAVLQLAAGVSLSRLINDLPQRHMASGRLKDFPAALSHSVLERIERNLAEFVESLGMHQNIQSTDQMDGLRITFENQTIIHLRPSGNAPELRCYIEASSDGDAKNILANTLEKLELLRVDPTE